MRQPPITASRLTARYRSGYAGHSRPSAMIPTRFVRRTGLFGIAAVPVVSPRMREHSCRIPTDGVESGEGRGWPGDGSERSALAALLDDGAQSLGLSARNRERPMPASPREPLSSVFGWLVLGSSSERDSGSHQLTSVRRRRLRLE